MVGPPVETTPKKTRRTWVVKQLLRSIFTGEFKGGDRLVEEELAATIGVSRTPVREAFAELAGIGLIVLKPNHGAVVRPFGPTQIREIYHIRGILESEAARMAAERIDMGALLHIRDGTRRFLEDSNPTPQASADMLLLDQQFHELISASCGSTRLAEEIARYRGLVQSVREAIGNKEHALDVARQEHTQIIEHLLARRGDEAAGTMKQHIARGAEAAVSALFASVAPRS